MKKGAAGPRLGSAMAVAYFDAAASAIFSTLT
jgi:hypothetical protein